MFSHSEVLKPTVFINTQFNQMEIIFQGFFSRSLWHIWYLWNSFEFNKSLASHLSLVKKHNGGSWFLKTCLESSWEVHSIHTHFFSFLIKFKIMLPILVDVPCISLHCRRKLEYLKSTHVQGTRTGRTTWHQMTVGFKSRTFFLWGNNANHSPRPGFKWLNVCLVIVYTNTY